MAIGASNLEGVDSFSLFWSILEEYVNVHYNIIYRPATKTYQIPLFRRRHPSTADE